MAVSRDEFFAELDTLTDQEIEQRLPLFDREQLLLVQQYIDRRGEEPQDQVPGRSKVSEPSSNSRIATFAALITARKAMSMAVAALILSIGAMLTAIVAGVIAYLMLPH